MTTQTLTATTTGTFGPIYLEQKKWQSGEGVGIVCSLSSNATAVNYTVQVTGDNIQLAKPTNWTNHPDLTAQTTGLTGNLEYPVTCAQLIVSSLASGSVTVSFVSTDLAG